MAANAQPAKTPTEVQPYNPDVNCQSSTGPKANSEVVGLGEDHLHGDWLVVSCSKKSFVAKGKGKSQEQNHGTGVPAFRKSANGGNMFASLAF
ncbi:YgiQ family radical SAM protein [Sesbania bispinosa]|nr:YgiQ family radical SAM protein [Sesbania bispinosa]